MNDADFRVVCLGLGSCFLFGMWLREEIVDSFRADWMELRVRVYDCVPDYGLRRGG